MFEMNYMSYKFQEYNVFFNYYCVIFMIISICFLYRYMLDVHKIKYKTNLLSAI